MQDRKQHIIEGWIAAVLLTILILCLVHRALAQEPPPEHSAFSAHGFAVMTVEYDTLDIAKLEAKAVDVLRTKSGLTLAEARAFVRVDGRTDVARCYEVIIPNHLKSITQGTVLGVRIENQHPEPVVAPAEGQ